MIGLGSNKKRWSIDCIAKVRELIGVSKRKVKADYDVVDALLCTCKRGSVSKCQNHDDGDDVDDVVDALLCTCNKGSVSKCQNHDDGDDDDDVVDALLCTCNRGSVSKCQRIKGTTHLASPRQPFYFRTIYCRHVYFGGGLLVGSYSSARKQCKGWYC